MRLGLAAFAGVLVLVVVVGASLASPFFNTPVDVTIVGDGSLAVSITGASTAELGSPITFTAIATGGTTPYFYAWNFGDGTGGGSGNPVSHIFQASGSYTVTLSTVDSSSPTQSSLASFTVTVPVAAIGDPGFESGILNFGASTPVGTWGAVAGGPVGTASVTSEDVHSGTNSLKLVGGLDNSSYAYVYQFYTLSSTTFTFSFWYKGLSGNMEAEILSGWTLGCGCGASTGIIPGLAIRPDSLFPVDGNWHHAIMVRTPLVASFYLDQGLVACEPQDPSIPPPTSIVVGDGSVNGESGTFYFDDVSLEVGRLLPASCASFAVHPAQNQVVNVGQLVPSLNVTLSLNVTVPVQLEIRRLESNPVENPVNKISLGVFFAISANRTTSIDARIRLFYNQSQVRGLDENTIAIYVFNSETGEWRALDGISRDTNANWIEGTVHHFSLFGVFSNAISQALPNTTSTQTTQAGGQCWYCGWPLWAATAIGVGVAGTGVVHRRNVRRPKKLPKAVEQRSLTSDSD